MLDTCSYLASYLVGDAGHVRPFLVGATPLVLATVEGRQEAVEAQINQGVDVNEQSKYGSPSHYAAAHGRQDLLPLLARGGADLNARDSMGYTPLMTAIAAGQNGFANQLLGRFVDVASQNDRGFDAIAFAALLHNGPMVRALSLAGADFGGRYDYDGGKDLIGLAAGANQDFQETLKQHVEMQTKMAQKAVATGNARSSGEKPIVFIRKRKGITL